MAHLKKLFRFNLTQSCSHSQSSLSLLAGGVWHEEKKIDHFTVVCSMTPTLNDSEPDVLSNQKTDLGSRGDVGLKVLHLHGISSGLQHSSVIISLSVIVYVPQNASRFARMFHNPKV